jgi:glycosyltransferase involved in cell wall biosynthesis
VNMLWCRPGKVGGSEEYLVRQLLGAAEACDASSRAAPTASTPASQVPIDVVIYAPRGFARAHPELAAAWRIVEAPSDCARRPLRVGLESTWFAAATRNADVVHDGGGTSPLIGSSPRILTIHDLQYTAHPEYFSAVKRAWLARQVPRAARRAAHIVTPTRFVADTVVKTLGVPANKVSVVRHGIEASLGTHATPEVELRRRFALTASEIIVFPAITHPHKNHALLLELLGGPWRGRDVQLVCAGGAGRADETLRERCRELGLGDAVRFTGRVTPADRDGLLKIATALVFPSRYEGFGAPVLEAMALGTPVVCSDQAALVEVVADAAIVRSLRVDAWVDVLDTVARQRASLVESGRRRAAEFTARASGEDLLRAYRRVIA